MKHKICGDCEHYTACASWNIGSISSMDAAHCANFKKVAIPSVPAVPLEPLCEWLTANRVSIPCRLCEYDDAGECTVQNDMSKPCPNATRDWRRVITKWMEGQDVQKEN